MGEKCSWCGKIKESGEIANYTGKIEFICKECADLDDFLFSMTDEAEAMENE